MSNNTNKNVVLVMGRPNTGKTYSVKNIAHPEKTIYLNCDLKKPPFAIPFAKDIMVEDPKHIEFYINEIESSGSGIDMVILDTMTKLMDDFARMYVVTAGNARDQQKAWGDYANFYQSWIHAIKVGTKNYAILAHEADKTNEAEMTIETYVPLQGKSGAKGVEADFGCVVQTKRMLNSELKKWENECLSFTEKELDDGFKHVFQTRVDKDCLGHKMRSPDFMWKKEEKYINNDLDLVFTKLNEYYK